MLVTHARRARTAVVTTDFFARVLVETASLEKKNLLYACLRRKTLWTWDKSA